MRALTFIFTILVGAMGTGRAQGLVNFSNSPFDYGDGVERRIFIDYVGGTLATDPTWTAQLWEFNLGSAYPISGRQPFLGEILPGVWQPAFVALNVPGGVETELQVAVFDGHGTLLVVSPQFSYTPPVSPIAPPYDYLMWNFRIFIIPEPSTLALFALGLVSLALFRRRAD